MTRVFQRHYGLKSGADLGLRRFGGGIRALDGEAVPVEGDSAADHGLGSDAGCEGAQPRNVLSFRVIGVRVTGLVVEG